MITLECNYSKKLGLPGYSSHQFAITLRTETVMQLVPEEKAPEIAFRVHDGLGVIQLHENWRN
jgi:hypothetical protein